VFAVKYRNTLIAIEWESDLYKYMTGIIQNRGQKLLAINGAANHIHILIGMKPTCCLSDLVRETKKASTAFVNTRKLTSHKFQWQEGFGAFSYSHSSLDNVIAYIRNQKEHHKAITFKEEYTNFLTKFNVDYKDEYLFDWNDDI